MPYMDGNPVRIEVFTKLWKILESPWIITGHESTDDFPPARKWLSQQGVILIKAETCIPLLVIPTWTWRRFLILSSSVRGHPFCIWFINPKKGVQENPFGVLLNFGIPPKCLGIPETDSTRPLSWVEWMDLLK